MKKQRIIFTFNAPAVLCFALLSLAAYGLGILTGDKTTIACFSMYRSSFLSPMTYLRMLGHVLGHTSFSHYVSNMALILALGPIVEERYGSVRLIVMFSVTSVISALFHVFLGGNSMIMGASGIVYMLIFLASTSGGKPGEIPLTLVAVSALYLTQEILGGLFAADSISHLSHIVGGICGAVMGLFFHK